MRGWSWVLVVGLLAGCTAKADKDEGEEETVNAFAGMYEVTRNEMNGATCEGAGVDGSEDFPSPYVEVAEESLLGQEFLSLNPCDAVDDCQDSFIPMYTFTTYDDDGAEGEIVSWSFSGGLCYATWIDAKLSWVTEGEVALLRVDETEPPAPLEASTQEECDGLVEDYTGEKVCVGWREIEGTKVE